MQTIEIQANEVSAIHAHRCRTCAAKGQNTLWIHGDENAENVTAHTCPKCGSAEWEKFMIPIQQAREAAKQAVVSHTQQIILLFVVCFSAAIVAYAFINTDWQATMSAVSMFIKKINRQG